jgi:hypothetical protein
MSVRRLVKWIAGLAEIAGRTPRHIRGTLRLGRVQARTVGLVDNQGSGRPREDRKDGLLVAAGLIVSTPTSQYICTHEGQMVAATTPGWASIAGVLIAAATCAVRRPWWIVGMATGYAIAFGGFAVGWFIAAAGQ